SWPGNVRELMHTIEHLVIISDHEVISVEDVKSVLRQNGGMDDDLLQEERSDMTVDSVMPITSLKEAKQELEISFVRRAYEEFHSSYKVAEQLGLSQAAVMKILKRHGYRLKNGNLEKIEI
ncbi:MAG: hypothetical protein IJF43_07345, partial [Firmicutes bacterium]|nr:hypothetical protein [Bacillota bacterium]